MSLTDTDHPESSPDSALPDHEPPAPDYTYEEFVQYLAKLSAPDTRRNAILRIVATTGGRPGVVIDVPALTVWIERTPETTVKVLRELVSEGWIRKRYLVHPETGRPVPEWYTALEVAG